MADNKTTLPFEEQFPGWLGLLAFDPTLFANVFQQTKPQLFKEMFPQGFDPASVEPFSRMSKDYNPWAYLSGGATGRPGGPSPQEQALLGGSLFGTTAPFGTSALAGSTQAQNALTAGMLP